MERHRLVAGLTPVRIRLPEEPMLLDLAASLVVSLCADPIAGPNGLAVEERVIAGGAPATS